MDGRENEVAQALDQVVRAGERRFADADHRNAVHVLQATLDDADAEHVGHEEERGGRALQLLEELDDARLRAQRQRDVDLAHAVRHRVGRDFGQRAEDMRSRALVDAIVAAIVEVADEGRAMTLAFLQGSRHLDAQRAGSDDDRGAARARLRRVAIDDGAADPGGQPLQHRRRDHPFEQHVALEVMQAARGIAAEREDRDQHGPRRHDVDRCAEEGVAEAVASGEGQREDQETQGQRRSIHLLVRRQRRHDEAEHGDARLEERGHQRSDRLRGAEKGSLAGIVEHQSMGNLRSFEETTTCRVGLDA